MKDLLLAIPCFNEGDRLPKFLPDLVEELQALKANLRIQIVDDGSIPAHHEAINECIESLDSDLLLPILTHEQNSGKGSAILTAWQSATDFRFVAFIDADGSIAAKDARTIIKKALSDRDKLWIASRAFPNQSVVDRTLFRKISSRVFHLFVWLRYSIRIRDTQCGFKIVPNVFYRANQDTFRQQGFAFDLELLLKATNAGVPIVEHPIDWKETPGGHLSIGAGIKLIWDVLRKRI